MVKLLARDTSSQVGAAVNGWLWPATREALVLMDLYDRYADLHYRNPRAQPRPWDKPKRIGRTALPPDVAIARLKRAAGRAA